MTETTKASAVASVSTEDLGQYDDKFLAQVRAVLELFEDALEEEEHGDPDLERLFAGMKDLLLEVQEPDVGTFKYIAPNERRSPPKIDWFQKFKILDKPDTFCCAKFTYRAEATATSRSIECARKHRWEREGSLVKKRPARCGQCPKRCPKKRKPHH